MGWFRRKRSASGGGSSAGRGAAAMDRGATKDDVRHLEEFVRTRHGVEAFVEPQTMATQTTVVLVAADGEWTRRRVDSAREAHRLAEKWAIPAYDAAVVGYPQRMRDWTARQKGQRPEV